MADLSKLSDADLEALQSGAMDKVSDAGLQLIAGETPYNNPAAAFLDAAGSGLAPMGIPVGTYYDKLMAFTEGVPEQQAKAQRIQRSRDNPASSGAGALTSMLLSMRASPQMFNSGKLADKIVSPLGKKIANVGLNTAVGAASGATGGFLANPDEDTTRIDNAKQSALVGALMSGGLSGLQQAFGGRQGAERLAFKALKPGKQEETEVLQDAGESIGRTLLDTGVLESKRGNITNLPIIKQLRDLFPRLPAGREAIKENIANVRKEVGSGIGNIVNRVDDAVGSQPVINRKEVAGRVREAMALNPQSTDYIDDASALNKRLVKMVEAGDLAPNKAQTLKEELQDQILASNKNLQQIVTDPIEKQAMEAERNVLAEMLGEQVEKRTPEASQPYKELLKGYSNLSKAKDVIDSTVASERSQSWRKVGVPIPMLGAWGMSRFVEKPEQALIPGAIVTAFLAAQKYGPQVGAMLLDKSINSPALNAGAQSTWNMIKDAQERGNQ